MPAAKKKDTTKRLARPTPLPALSPMKRAEAVCRLFWSSRGRARDLEETERDLRGVGLDAGQLKQLRTRLPNTTGTTAALVTRLDFLIQHLIEEGGA